MGEKVSFEDTNSADSHELTIGNGLLLMFGVEGLVMQISVRVCGFTVEGGC